MSVRVSVVPLIVGITARPIALLVGHQGYVRSISVFASVCFPIAARSYECDATANAARSVSGPAAESLHTAAR